MTSAPALLDTFMPHPDVRERFHTIVAAPASVVFDVACQFDMQTLPLARAIFRMREVLMRAPAREPRRAQGILAETLGLGWGTLHHDANLVIVGARCQPWLGAVVFTAIPPGDFAAWAGPEHVKIAWTLEADAIGASRTRFSHETRVVATDETARRRFRRYWRWARFGIVGIRYLLVPAVRREAERRWATERLPGAGAGGGVSPRG
jgi:hypothetical protein